MLSFIFFSRGSPNASSFIRFLHRVSNVATRDRWENREVRSVEYWLLIFFFFFLSELIVQSLCSETWFDDVHVCGCLRDEFINGFDRAELAWSHGYQSFFKKYTLCRNVFNPTSRIHCRSKRLQKLHQHAFQRTWKTDDKWLHIRQNAGTLHTLLIIFAG